MAELTDEGYLLKQKVGDDFKKVERLINKSKGKFNSMTLARLMLCTEADDDKVEEVFIKLDADKVDSIIGVRDTCIYERNNREYFNKEVNKRKQRDANGRSYEFEDTYIYRALQRCGMDYEAAAKDVHRYTYSRGLNPDGTLRKSYNVGDKRADQFSTAPMHGWTGTGSSALNNSVARNSKCTDFITRLNLYYMCGEDLAKKIVGDEDLSYLLTVVATVKRKMGYVNSGDRTQYDQEGWRKFQIGLLAQEFAMLADCPEDMKENISACVKECKDHGSYSSYTPFLSQTALHTFRYPNKAENTELLREAFDSLKFMGIGVMINAKDSQHKRGADGYKVGVLLNKVSSMVRQFLSDIKKGHSPEAVRKLVVEDLNNWNIAKCRNQWAFFPLQTVDVDYSEYMPKKKAKKATNSKKEEKASE